MLPIRHASIDVLIFFWLTFLLTSTTIAANRQPSTTTAARKFSKSFPFFFRICCQRYKGFRRGKLNARHTRIIPRGGGQQHHDTEILAAQRVIPLSLLPLIDTTSVSLALRLTCETNRRLHHGTSIAAGASTDFLSMNRHTLGPKDHQHYTSPTLCTHTIQSVPESEQIEERRVEELTLFHRMDVGDRAGDEKHGNSTESLLPRDPDLESYLNTLLCSIGINKDCSDIRNKSSTTRTIAHDKPPIEDETQVILSLIILYLDRSTSPSQPLYVNPLIGRRGYPQCPHVLPQTVHRLLLTALSIATKFVRGDKAVSNTLREAANSMMDERHAVSLMDMEKMEDWMIHAMSSTTEMHTIQQHHHHHEMAWQISHDEISRLLRKWGGTFYPQRLAAHDQTRMEQQARLWREQHGANHGHGNYWADQSSSMESPSTHDGDHQWQYPGNH